MDGLQEGNKQKMKTRARKKYHTTRGGGTSDRHLDYISTSSFFNTTALEKPNKAEPPKLNI